MNILKRILKIIVEVLLFCTGFTIIDLLKGVSIEYIDNLIKAICSVVVMYGCKLSYIISKNL